MAAVVPVLDHTGGPAILASQACWFDDEVMGVVSTTHVKRQAAKCLVLDKDEMKRPAPSDSTTAEPRQIIRPSVRVPVRTYMTFIPGRWGIRSVFPASQSPQADKANA